MKKITVILLCWKRFEHFEDIIKFWLSQPNVDEVIVGDNSGQFKTDLPATLVFNISKNIGPIARYPLVQFAKNDIILFCDDDAKHQDGILENFFTHYHEDKILGIRGLNYTDTYKTSTKVKANEINNPIEVDYVATNTCMTHRKNCLVDIKKCPGHYFLDDMWWLEESKSINKNVSFWIIPTNKFAWYPESNTEDAIHLNPKTYVARELFFKKRKLGK